MEDIGTSFCGWYGIACDVNGHVPIFDLVENRLTGTLPPEIGNLSRLNKLYLCCYITS
jgi:hypothetical protein